MNACWGLYNLRRLSEPVLVQDFFVWTFHVRTLFVAPLNVFIKMYLQDDIGTLEDSLKLLVKGLGRPICDVVLHFLPELESCVMLELLAGSVSNEAI